MKKEKNWPLYLMGAISGACFSACAFIYTFHLTNEWAGLVMCICAPLWFCLGIASFGVASFINNSICTIIGGVIGWLIGCIIISQWSSFTLVIIFFVIFIAVIFSKKIKPLFGTC